MSQADGPGEFAPPAPKPEDFQVFWSDNDRPVSDYTEITGSSFDSNRLILARHDAHFIINFDEVRLIIIRESKP